MSRSGSVKAAFSGSQIFGLPIGFGLAFFEDFQYYALLNLTGLILELASIGLLSSVLLMMSSEAQNVLADYISRYFVICSGTLPASIGMGAAVALFFGAASYYDVWVFSAILAAILALPSTLIFGSAVFEPLLDKDYPADYRLKVLGVTFLIVGFALQIFASGGQVVGGAE